MSAEVEDASEAPTLSKQPWNTLRLFAKYMGNIVFASIQKAALNPLTTCLVYPAIACYVVLKVMGLFPAFIREAEMWFSYTSWWLLLGILSSIGLGSGLHSGVLFLFPHVFKVCLAVESCGHTDFDVRDDVWLRGNTLHCEPLSLPAEHQSTLASATPASLSEDVTALDLFCKVIYTGMIWGAGTAIGEVPPYFFSYMMQSEQIAPAPAPATTSYNGSASKQHSTGPLPSPDRHAGTKNGHKNGLSSNGGGNGASSTAQASKLSARSKEDSTELLLKTLEVGIGAQPGGGAQGGSVFTAVEKWLSSAVNRHGFLMVVSLASFPNPLFDMCGLACGRCRMPFRTFFSATLIGKGIVKVCIQVGTLVALIQERSREAILDTVRRCLPHPVVLLSPHLPLGEAVSKSVHSGIEQFQGSVRHMAGDHQRQLWGSPLRLDGGAWLQYAQSLAPRSFTDVWGSVVGLIMLFFVWSFVETLAQVQWRASHAHTRQEKLAKTL